jgi:5-methylthioadenosine/S-adenosylhomocysteine deaminase
MAVVISNGLVATFDEEMRLIENGSVKIVDGVIAAVGSASDIPPSSSDTAIDAGGCLVMPGLTNGHCHSIEVWGKGRTDRMPLEDWLDAIFPAIDQLPAEFIRVAVLLIAAEMLKTGVTSVVDHFRQTPARLDAVGAAVAAYRECGMNASIAIMLRDRVIPKGIDLPTARHQFSVQAQAELCKEAIRMWHAPADGISIALGPSAPHRCTDDLLAVVGDLGEQFDLKIQTHVDENLSQRREADAHYGCSTVRHLSALGLLGPRLSLAHVTWVDEPDMDLLARTGTWTVHNPVSNVRLGSGIAPIAGLHRRNVGVALGTDGAASNDSQNLLEVMKLAALLPALREAQPSAAPVAKDIAIMATRSGGQLLGGRHGALALGLRGDVIVIPLEDAPFRPLNDVYRQLVYAGARSKVKHAVIGGHHVVDDGKVTTFDEQSLYREAEDLKQRIYHDRTP